MRIIVKTKDLNFHMPVPLGLVRFAISKMPEAAFVSMRKDIPTPYDKLVSKKYLGVILGECIDVLKGNKGLEIVHVEACDGTYVSITL